MNHSTLLITRRLSDEDAARLREKLRELWPHDAFTIHHGTLETLEPRDWVPGPSEHKMQISWERPGDVTTLTPPPEFET